MMRFDPREIDYYLTQAEPKHSSPAAMDTLPGPSHHQRSKDPAESKKNISLKRPSNQATSKNMTVTREEIDAKIALSEARVEARLAEMNGKFDLVLAKMDTLASAVAESRQDSREESRHIRNTQWAAAGALLAILGLGLSLWHGGIDLGTKIGDLVDQKVAAIAPTEPAPAPAEAPPAPPQQ